MYTQEYSKMYDLEDRYWWFVGRKSVIRAVLDTACRGRKDLDIVDVGCGTGSILNILSGYGRVTGSDISETALSFCRKRGFTNLVRTSADNLELKEEGFDLVTAFDILEHLDDDRKALSEFYRVCRRGGNILITVPAYGFLWSEHDRALGHKRRYVYREVCEKVRSAGFRIRKTSYFITFLLPVIAVFRIIQNIFRKSGKPDIDYIMPPEFLNRIFIWLLVMESLVVRFFGFPLGVSLICLAEKPEK